MSRWGSFCTLYLVDEKHSELWTISGGVQIRLPKSSGIAGLVATSGEIVNIPDAYKDSRFNQAFDKKSGYHTKTILCLPIKDAERKVVGVLQLINKLHGPFTPQDEELLEGFLTIVGGIIHNSKVRARFRLSDNYCANLVANVFLSLYLSLSLSLSLRSLQLFTITQGRNTRAGTDTDLRDSPAALVKEKSSKAVKPMGVFEEDEEEEEEEED